MKRIFTIEIEEGTKFKGICGAIVTCREDGSGMHVNMINLNEDELATIIGLRIDDCKEAKLISQPRKETEEWEQ